MYKINTIIIFFLCLIAIPMLFSVYTIIEQKIIEHGMMEKLEKENLQTITLDKSSLIWLKKNKELLINGEPFDIKHYFIHGKNITVTGLFDKKEKELKKLLQSGIENREQDMNIMKIFFLSFYFVTKDQTEKLRQSKLFDFATCIDKRPTDLSLPVIAPPPRYI